jgi:hypothetical protein
VLIKARLKGHEFDLITLAELFREGEPAVAADAEGYYLSFSAPEEVFRDGGRLYDAASVVLRRVNAIGRVLTDEFRRAGLTGRFHDEAGQQHQVVLADSAEVRGRAFAAVAVADGQEPPPPSPAPGPYYVQLAETHPDVAEGMDILGRRTRYPNGLSCSRCSKSSTTTPRAASSGAGSAGARPACSRPLRTVKRSAASSPAMLATRVMRLRTR